MSVMSLAMPPSGAKAGQAFIDRYMGESYPGFNDCDYQGYPGPQTRITYETAQGRVWARFRLLAGDVAGQWGNHRAEGWRHPHDLAEGDVSWHLFAWLFDDKFRPPTAWMNLGQIHCGDNDPGDGTPTFSHEVLPNGTRNLSLRGSGHAWPLGAIVLGTPQLLLVRIAHSAGKGRVLAWPATGVLPDETKPAPIDWEGPTLIGGNGWTKFGIYSNQDNASCEALGICGRGSTAAEAKAVWGSSTTTPPPPVKTIKGSIAQGAVLTGPVAWTADNGPCDFLIDGKQSWHEDLAPYVFAGDGGTLYTTTLAEGPHTFRVQLADGSASHEVSATVKNTVTPPPPPADPCAQVKADLAAAAAEYHRVATNLSETEAALTDATDRLELARKLLRDQITAWRSEKPARSWQWIQKQPAGKAYYGPLGGK